MKILLVEDHPAVRRSIGSMLLEMGHAVEAVATVADASRPAIVPDVIVADFLLGELTARDVSKLWPATPIVVVSGDHQPIDFRGEWVMKPIGVEDLRTAIDRAAQR